MKYTFEGLKPCENVTTVEAEDEIEARHLAMKQRWPNTLVPGPSNMGKYAGLGLSLVKVEP